MVHMTRERMPDKVRTTIDLPISIQVRAVAKTRLSERLGRLEPATMQAVTQALRITLDI